MEGEAGASPAQDPLSIRRQKKSGYCCVIGCHTHQATPGTSMYRFPKKNALRGQQWARAIRRLNPDGSDWRPSPHSRICSLHFVGGKPHPTELHPAYLPTLFPLGHTRPKTEADLARHQRFMKRRQIEALQQSAWRKSSPREKDVETGAAGNSKATLKEQMDTDAAVSSSESLPKKANRRGGYCVADGCHSHKGTEGISLFRFPKINLAQRHLWIQAVNRRQKDGTPWQPTAHSRLCSKHFVGGKPNKVTMHPDHVPSIFPKRDGGGDGEEGSVSECSDTYSAVEGSDTDSISEDELEKDPSGHAVTIKMEPPFYGNGDEEEGAPAPTTFVDVKEELVDDPAPSSDVRFSVNSRPKYSEYCCVVGCSSAYGKAEKVSLHRFPKRNAAQREKWIQAIQRRNPDGTPWRPGKYHKVCAKHFVGGRPSPTEISPSYIPTIFPTHTVVHSVNAPEAVERQRKFIERIKQHKTILSPASTSVQLAAASPGNKGMRLKIMKTIRNVMTQTKPELFTEQRNPGDPAVFVALVQGNTVATQFSGHPAAQNETENSAVQNGTATTVANGNKSRVPSTSVILSKEAENAAPSSKNVERAAEESRHERVLEETAAAKILVSDEAYESVAGVPKWFFTFLFGQVNIKVSAKGMKKADKLLLFLSKLKSNTPFIDLAKTFGVSRPAAEAAFRQMLRGVCSFARRWPQWLPRDKVRATMPGAFRDAHPNCRVVIGAGQLECSPQPDSADEATPESSSSRRHYKFLIGVAPSGFITLLPKCQDTSVSDTRLARESGILDLLEAGDEVLSVSGFPRIVADAAQDAGFALVDATAGGGAGERARAHVQRALARLGTFKMAKFLEPELDDAVDDVLASIRMICNNVSNVDK